MQLVQFLVGVLYGQRGATVVTHSPPTSEVSGLNSEPYVRKLVLFTDGQQFTVQTLDQLKTTHYDMTHTMLKAT